MKEYMEKIKKKTEKCKPILKKKKISCKLQELKKTSNLCLQKLLFNKLFCFFY